MFFGGKGGVGKTTCSTAYAVAASAAGRVLLVSTDPAHSVADALEIRPSAAARVVPGTGGRLLAAQIDAERALGRWLERRRPALRLLARRASVLDDQDVARLSALPLPGVDELVGLLELRRLARLTRAATVVVDTAPTGHTLRLLAAPALLGDLSRALEELLAEEGEVRTTLGGRRARDPADALVAELADQAAAQAELLQDAERCGCVWVTLPEELALAESRDGVSALRRAGIAVEGLIVNRAPPPGAAAVGGNPAGHRRALVERRLVVEIERAFPKLPVRFVPELDHEPRGVPELRALGRLLVPAARGGRGRAPSAGTVAAALAGLPARRGRRAGSTPAGRSGAELVDLLAPPRLRLLFFAGKGGVGKTSCAAAAALALAAGADSESPVRRLLLVSVDPAHSLGDVLRLPLRDRARRVPPHPDRLRARELDPAASWRRWRDRLAAAAAQEGSLSGSLDDLLQLTPPGVDELLAVLEVSTLMRRRSRAAAPELVVVDCAPTGHALRLLRMPGVALGWTRALLEILLKYRRVAALGPLAAELLRLARALRELEELLRDPTATAVCIVTRAGVLPGRETERLARELRRLEIRVAALLGVGAPPARPVAGRAALPPYVMIFCPWRWPPPRGARELERWVAAWEETNWSSARP